MRKDRSGPPSLRFVWPLGALVAFVGCGPNLTVRNATVTWNATTKVATAEVANIGNRPAGEFLVYFNGEENPMSSNHRPQVRLPVAGLAAGTAVVLTADFAPLAHPDNASLGNVHRISITADPKSQIAERREDDNETTVPLP